MARRRKSDSKTPVKTPAKAAVKPVAVKAGAQSTVVRKSTRQIARKQLQQQKKANGEVSQVARLTYSEESGGSQNDQKQPAADRIPKTIVHKKFGKYRRPVKDEETADVEHVGLGAEIIKLSNANLNVGDENTITGESDSHDGVVTVAAPSAKLIRNDDSETTISVSNTNDLSSTEHASDEVVWQEEVVEETIICEEMEVEGDAIENTRYTIAQDGTVVLEEVLLVNEQDYDEEGVVEYTVIQNEDGSESMVVAGNAAENEVVEQFVQSTVTLPQQSESEPAVNQYEEVNEYRVIEGVKSLSVTETEEVNMPCESENSLPSSSENEKSDHPHQDARPAGNSKKGLIRERRRSARARRVRTIFDPSESIERFDKLPVDKSRSDGSQDSVVSVPGDGSDNSLKCAEGNRSSVVKYSRKDAEIYEPKESMDCSSQIDGKNSSISTAGLPGSRMETNEADEDTTNRQVDKELDARSELTEINSEICELENELSNTSINDDLSLANKAPPPVEESLTPLQYDESNSLIREKAGLLIENSTLGKPEQFIESASTFDLVENSSSTLEKPKKPVKKNSSTSDKPKKLINKVSSTLSEPDQFVENTPTFNRPVEATEKTSLNPLNSEKLIEDTVSTSEKPELLVKNTPTTPDKTEELTKNTSSTLDNPEQLIANIFSTLEEPGPFVNEMSEINEKTSSSNDSVTDERKYDSSTDPSDSKQSETRSEMKQESIQEVETVGEEKSRVSAQTIEESSRDSEMDGKVESEDVKLSSSSENSSDTLLSTNGCKIPEFADIKSIPNQQNESEKKPGFRSRSGSTDTTGSESGSNSSGVRRSSRIRSIGLMKQRSRGRGLVTKPNLDLSRAIFQQDRDKLANSNSTCSQESKDNSDNQSETQSDKESSSNKTITSLDSPAPLPILVGSAGYESDSSKPVKVKSRWRRSSELEMGGSGSLKAQTPSESDATSETSSLVADSLCTRTSTPPVSKFIGAKILLPTVPEIKDREMEERLSQFDQLAENLYLTERYTNKETKRMVCDCFLTEDEIARGELGCGEDCLNRLLMIECGPRCVVGDRCTNRRFQNCDYAKCEVFRTEKKGFGLRAVADLYAGEFIMEYVGEVVDPKDFRRRAKDYSKDKNRHYYFMALKSDQIIDATMKGNISRFINHSCDPNSETQKWTVNGELRIGFFNKKSIAAGEEITFDYHFQRYGKEAQKCFCEAENCRGWIGDTPEEEKEKIEKKEIREKDVTKKKKEEKKTLDYMEDEDLEEEIDKLCSGGLKNRAHTLTLSRLMVRSRELQHRTRLLRLIQSGEQPCRRLFLDYHGLRLVWSYTMDVATNESEEAQQFRLEILKTLNTLPIPNKTMLMDSKVYGVVEKWAKSLCSSPSGGSPENDQTKTKISSEEPDSSCDVDSNDKPSSEQLNDKRDKEAGSSPAPGDVKQEVEEAEKLEDLAAGLLSDWSNLKEVFRIPKKERIEQMKEHEREADRGYKEDLEKGERRDKSYDRHRSDRYGRTDDKRLDRRRGRESPDHEYNRSKDKRFDERGNLVPIPRMSKYERRQLFAMKVAKEEEERQRRQQQETWQEHEARCLALGMDPHTTAALDPQTGYPLFFNPQLGQWQPYPMQDPNEMAQCTPMYNMGGPLPGVPGHSQPGMMTPNPHILPPGVPPPVYATNQQNPYNPMNSPYPVLPHHHQQYPEGHLHVPGNLIPIQNGTPPITLQNHPMYVDKPVEQQFPIPTPVEPVCVQPTPVELPPMELPPKWKSAKDALGRTYYYHVKDRASQWLPPPPDHITAQAESSSSSESSEESSSSEEEDEDMEEDADEDLVNEDVVSAMEVDNELMESPLISLRSSLADNPDSFIGEENPIVIAEPKKRRDGLVQERIISPRREDDRVDHKKYKEIKEKLRRQKEKAKLKEHVDKLKKHRRSGKSKSHSRHSLSKLQTNVADGSSTLERKIKDAFRINMANVMVHFLNPYRKNDCKQGRITNTEDFKHLARKLTHFVLAKELKHCKSVDELQCNDNVKHKAKDFVRKYMSKFGAVYQKATDED